MSHGEDDMTAAVPKPGPGTARWLGGWLVAAVLCSCAPTWTGAQVLTATRAAPAVRLASDATPRERLLDHYATEPLGERVREKRVKVLVVHVGDVAIYRHDAGPRAPTLSAVLRSYTSFRDRSLEDVDQFLTKVEAGYVVAADEVERVRRFIRQAVEPVNYYRVDLRYTVGESHGAVLIYEFREEGEDRLLDAMLLSPPTALSAIHFADLDGFALATDATVLGDHYRATDVGGTIDLRRRRTP